MKKSSSRPRLSQPSGDGSQTVAFFFHNAHFPIIGELSKKQVVNVGQQLTLSPVFWTFLVFLPSKTFSQNVADIENFTRDPHFLHPLKPGVIARVVYKGTPSEVWTTPNEPSLDTDRTPRFPHRLWTKLQDTVCHTPVRLRMRERS